MSENGISVWYSIEADKLFLTWACYAKLGTHSENYEVLMGNVEANFYIPVGIALDTGDLTYLIEKIDFSACEFIGFL